MSLDWNHTLIKWALQPSEFRQSLPYEKSLPFKEEKEGGCIVVKDLSDIYHWSKTLSIYLGEGSYNFQKHTWLPVIGWMAVESAWYQRLKGKTVPFFVHSSVYTIVVKQKGIAQMSKKCTTEMSMEYCSL